MEKLDRLGWAAGIAFTAYGHRIGIRVSEENALERVLACLPPGWKRTASPEVDCLYSLVVGGAAASAKVRRYHLLYLGNERLARTHDPDEVYATLDEDLKLHVAEAAEGRLFVHAGVVGWRGRAIVLPGPSYAGKSTLVAALLRAGATYYSDEYAVFDSQGRVHPYARPIALREQPGGSPRKCGVEAVGRSGRRPLPAGLVVLTRYREGARWRPRALSPGRALLALLESTVPARRQPEVALSTLREVVTRAPVLKGVRGEAEEMVAALLDRARPEAERRMDGAMRAG